MNIAIIGATGLVGRTVIKLLKDYNIDFNNIYLFASNKSNGKILRVKNKKVIVKNLSFENLQGLKIDFALFCCKENISKTYIPMLLKNNVKVIDFSSAYRKKYPLIVPEINSDAIKGNLICNPNCSTIASVMALNMINKAFDLKQIVYSTYQAVSGAGKLALQDMLTTNPEKLKKLNYVIKNNVIPCIGNIDNNYYSTEENKMIFETKKILGDNDIKISATCVRVPVKNGHSISINFVTKKATSINKIKKLLLHSQGVKFLEKSLPMPIDASGQNLVIVGRLRKDNINKNGFNLFVASDNILKGAAQNGVQILKQWVKNI